MPRFVFLEFCYSIPYILASRYCTTLQNLDEARHRAPAPLDPYYEDNNKADPMAEMQEVENNDPFKGRRVHAWVMIQAGKRDIAVSVETITVGMAS